MEYPGYVIFCDQDDPGLKKITYLGLNIQQGILCLVACFVIVSETFKNKYLVTSDMINGLGLILEDIVESLYFVRDCNLQEERKDPPNVEKYN